MEQLTPSFIHQNKNAGFSDPTYFLNFFIVIAIEFSISSIFIRIQAEDLIRVNVYSRIFDWTYLLIIFVPILCLLLKYKITPEQLGVRLSGAAKSLLEGIIVAVLILVPMALLRGYNFKTMTAVFATPWAALYFFHATLQEFIARGVVQTSIFKFIPNSNKIVPIILAAVIFGFFHLHFGFDATLIALSSGILFGFMYFRHQNLLGVSFLHFCLGWLAFSSSLI